MRDRDLTNRAILGLHGGLATRAATARSLGVDARVLGADVHRVARLAEASLRGVPVFAAGLLSEAWGWSCALAFGESASFHEVVRSRASLFESALVYYRAACDASSSARGVLELEAARIRVLASEFDGESLGRDGFRLAAAARVVEVSVRSLEVYGERCRSTPSLGWAEAVDLARRGVGGLDFHDNPTPRASVLVLKAGVAAVTLEPLETGMSELLRRISRGATRRELASDFSEDLDADELDALLEELLADGVILSERVGTHGREG